jgi:two-component system, NarL family, sensor histidine kinase BarA
LKPDDSANPTWDATLQGLTLGTDVRLEELVDREALGEMARSFQALLGISLRIFSADGHLLAEAATEQAICRYVVSLAHGRRACRETVDLARRAQPQPVTQDHPSAAARREAVHACFSGAQYRIFPIEYDGRQLGKAVLGPYLPAEVASVPDSLLAIDPSIDPAQARELLPRMPRAKTETITRLSDHLVRTLDLILFSGHKALLTSQMHLASVRESYRELQEKNKKLQEAFDTLKQLDRLKSNFLGTVSHELRTPLTSIIGYSEMLGEEIAGPLSEEQKEFVKTIHDKGYQLLELITSMLDMSKLESGTVSLRKTPFAVADLLDEVVATFAPRAQKRNIVFECDCEAELPEINADPDRLRQVFANLADNAIKFSPDGAAVRLTARLVDPPADETENEGFALLGPTRRLIEVRVEDRGIGIPEVERDRIFDAFYQVDSSSTREYGGSGLGLSIVKRLVEAHGGKVRVLVNEPQGSVFAVTLPL